MNDSSYENSTKIKVFDFFSGCGGASKGFEMAGLDPVFAIDNDMGSCKTFIQNFENYQVYDTLDTSFDLDRKAFFLLDMQEVPTNSISKIVNKYSKSPLLFTGCAPCQPFSHQQTVKRKEDPRKSLLYHFQRFVEEYKPEYIFIENVPGLQNVKKEDGGPFQSFIETLERLEYKYESKIVHAQNYGVPQKRRRLILIASLLGKIDFPNETHGPGTEHPLFSTVEEWMGSFPPLKAGETHPDIPNHQANNLSDLNLQRITKTPVGGDRRDFPNHLKLACHSNGYKGHTDVYGRIKWNELSNCLTTKCVSLSNGRYGHPTENRAISAREAACIQTFPRDFIFKGSNNIAAKQIGNAVPVFLAQQFGKNFFDHYKRYIMGKEDGKI